MVSRLFFIFLLFVSTWANSATVTVSTGYTATVADFSCDTVIAAMKGNYSGAVAGGCASQTVGVNTTLYFFNSSGGAAGTPYVNAVSGWSAPSSGGTLQTQINTLQTNVSGLSSRMTTLENGVANDLTNFSWSGEAFDTAVSGTLVMFGIGLGVGFIISLVRKMRV